jgi:hypothetical protein
MFDQCEDGVLPGVLVTCGLRDGTTGNCVPWTTNILSTVQQSLRKRARWNDAWARQGHGTSAGALVNDGRTGEPFSALELEPLGSRIGPLNAAVLIALLVLTAAPMGVARYL